MMKNKKKLFCGILAVLLCAAMVLPLASCNKKPNDNNGNNNNGGQIDNAWWTTEGELTKDENGNVAFNNVSIRLETVVAGDDKDAFNMLVEKFNREYSGKIRVNVTNTGAGTYESTVASKITNNNNAPDLIMSHQKSHKNFADNHLIQPLNEAMQLSGITIDVSNYASGLSQYSSLGYNDYTFSIPVDGQSMVVFYNKKALAALGKSLPTNRTELLELCEAYKQSTGKTPIAWDTSGDYFANYVYISAILQNGGTLYDESTYLTSWYDDETNRNAIHNASEAFREMFSNGYARFAESSSTILSEFIAGNRLFYFTNPWSMTDLVTQYAERENVSEETLIETTLGGTTYAGWFAMSDNAAKDYIFGDSHFFAMTKNVTDIHKKAAILEFIKWFTNEASVGSEWAKAGHISVSKAISESETYQKDTYVSNFISKFYPDINNFRCVGNTPHYEAIISNLKAIFSDTVDNNGGHTAERDYSVIKQKQDAVNNSINFFG